MKKIMLIILIAFGNVIFGQDAIINEWSQGTGGYEEWVEILIITDELDLRGWDIGDDSPGDLTFADIAQWSSITEGTLIVIYNGGDKDPTLPNDDTDFSDKVVVMPDDNSTYFSGSWGSLANTTDTDNPILRNSSGTIVHDWDQTENSNFTDLHAGATQSVYYTSNSATGITNSSNWIRTTASSATPGQPNGGDNTTWINTVLPVELVSFTAASTSSETVELNWKTATEVNNYGFEIERASSLTSPILSWETIGFVEGHGNSNSPKEYEFIDENPPSGNLEYRLKQIDTDGQFEYFNITAKVDNQVTDVNDEAIDGIPGEFNLSQNFPNPFNPTTIIKYEIPENGNVELKLYDMLGKEVATVVNEVQNAGVHYERFNAANLASGVYIYALKFGNYYDAKKLTLIY